MKDLKNTILEKLIINKNIKINDYYKFKVYNIEVKLPFKIKLVEQQEAIYIYHIEYTKNDKVDYYKFYDERNDLVCYLNNKQIQTVFKDNKTVSATIINNNGYKYYKAELIKYAKE
jgi:hypothetical protein